MTTSPFSHRYLDSWFVFSATSEFDPTQGEVVNKHKLAKFKRNVKHYTPEIVAGVTVVAGIGAALYLRKQMSTPMFQIHIDPAMADSILVLEQISHMTYRDLDTGEFFHVTQLVD